LLANVTDRLVTDDVISNQGSGAEVMVDPDLGEVLARAHLSGVRADP
jgi:hypothetical protein